MKITERLKIAGLDTLNVLEVCGIAKDREDSGEYSEAVRAMGEWWSGVGERPDVSSLPASERGAILSRVGSLSGWLGSMQQVQGSQEKAKNLISEGANLFESVDDHESRAEARSDLAICYWREGAFDEARIILQDLLYSGSIFTPELRGKILLRLVTVEISNNNFETAHAILNQIDILIKNTKNFLLLGKFYYYRAFAARSRGEDQNRPDLFFSAIKDYNNAGLYYKKINHEIFSASVENNLGDVYRLLQNYKKAHRHFDKAINLFLELKDRPNVALTYENKTRAFLAENKLQDAEAAIRASVDLVHGGDEKAILAESLTTFGVVLSRGGNVDYAIRTFEEAKDTALSVGDLESAGNAVLTQIEELRASLAPVVIRELYLEANELLKKSSKISSINRLRVIAAWQFEIDNPKSPLKDEKYFDWKNFSLPQTVQSYEREFILKALNESEGRITRAAKLLGISHQSLSLIMHKRHRDLQQYSVKRKPRDC